MHVTRAGYEFPFSASVNGAINPYDTYNSFVLLKKRLLSFQKKFEMKQYGEMMSNGYKMVVISGHFYWQY